MGDTRVFVEHTGTILHVDGDKKYSEKSEKMYQKLGLNAIVKNISEKEQPKIIKLLLYKYMPDIVVITGHDKMIKKGRRLHDIYNYKNSKYFAETVKMARRWERETGHEIAIFAGACQSFYEAMIMSGANFASSPGRVLIDFLDPIIVAQKIAKTDNRKYISINEIAKELKTGTRGISGIR